MPKRLLDPFIAADRARYRLSAGALAVAGLVAGAWAWPAPDAPPVVAPEPDTFFTAALSGETHRGYDFYEGLKARSMPFCVGGARANCIVDGDEFYLNGMHLRVANVAVPDLDGACLTEIARAREARATLQQLLDNQPVALRGRGRDESGRVLAEVETPSGDVGRLLIRFRVAAVPDTAAAGEWCQAPKPRAELTR